MIKSQQWACCCFLGTYIMIKTLQIGYDLQPIVMMPGTQKSYKRIIPNIDGSWVYKLIPRWPFWCTNKTYLVKNLMCIHFQAVVWQVYIEYFESIQLEVPVVYTVFITEHPNRLS